MLRVAPELVRLSWPWSALTCGSLLCVAPSRSARMRDISRSALPLRRSGLSDNCDMVVAAVVCVAAPKKGEECRYVLLTTGSTGLFIFAQSSMRKNE